MFSRNFNRVGRLLSVTLSGLPELWPPNGAVRRATLELTAHWNYVGQDNSASNLQYPRIELYLGVQPNGAPRVSQPLNDRLASSLELFDVDCSDAERTCCPFGSTECSTELFASVQRLSEGDFPDVELEWRSTAKAELDDCPLQDAVPKLEVEVIGP